MKALCTLIIALLAGGSLLAQDLTLPAPQKTGGRPLMEVLARRASSREFDAVRELSPQQLSNLLWATFGINRPDGRRTAPSARNAQELDVYVLLKTGVFIYDARQHQLAQLAAEDCRELAGTQPFARSAPVTLVFVADLVKAGATSSSRDWACIDTGYLSQNAYLYCASEGLATVARVSVDKAALGPKLKLRSAQEIVLAQSVGHPAK
jgi:SagB-type dehydrogenase family enzyme